MLQVNERGETSNHSNDVRSFVLKARPIGIILVDWMLLPNALVNETCRFVRIFIDVLEIKTVSFGRFDVVVKKVFDQLSYGKIKWSFTVSNFVALPETVWPVHLTVYKNKRKNINVRTTITSIVKATLTLLR
jgi:hypothetical protein